MRLRSGKLLGLGLLGLVGSLGAAQVPAAFRLDAEGGVGGLRFGQAAAALPDFDAQFRQQGRARMSTRLYRCRRDTGQLGGLGRPDSYWFRQGKFVGVDLLLRNRPATHAALAWLTNRYGPAQVDSTRAGTEYYWLGRRTFIMLTQSARGGGAGYGMLGSTALLNELVVETAVRARARRELGWQPDSLGLPKQLPVR